ncbi:TetR/AcrR family transcriptional regulator [Streptomyces buecherae]|uniref:TetR/AcrR family transcriptional regulator n=1 Tax=Streptomyces buecherae TaxID=2763006 RepID=A0A7H8N997_9ACTN|nr:TetR/AcrR family transcriptional regulator [Streptomyces buecherae]QKW50983.1 TetR/AcrR family transcriptional regulator [Streptomyces buecherae]
MASSVQRKRIRKSPADRRTEIVAAAASLALIQGLECITLRRVSEQLDVRPGLISHYFPAVEDLVAEAFGDAATAELDALLPAERPDGTPLEHLARFFAHAAGRTYDDISRLWINARHLSRYRPVLRDRVGEQEAAWRGRLTGLIREGVERGEFHAADPEVAATQILVVIDGLGAYVNTDIGPRPEAVSRMAAHTAERALGLGRGTLTPRDATADASAPAPEPVTP